MFKIPGFPRIGKVNVGITNKDRAIAQTVTRPFFSPDRPRLYLKPFHHVFLTDQFKSDRRFNFVIEGAIHRFEAFTRGLYYFWTRTEDDLPIIIPAWDNGGYKIRGEIVTVLPSVVERLDMLRQNGIQFRRVRVWAIDPYRVSCEFENIDYNYNIINGRFPDGHPLAGVKHYISEERTFLIRPWMYISLPYWLPDIQRHPEKFEYVPRFKPNHPRPWLKSEYYEYQNPPR